jgi:hypothetical protein
LKNNLSCILLENTNAVVRIGRRLCITCLGNNQHTHSNHTCSLAPLYNLNKKYCTQINTPYNPNINNKTTIEKGLFYILDLLRHYDKRDMAKELWIVR